MAGFLLGIRGRLVLLALAAAVPALLAVLYSAYTQYEQTTEDAKEQVERFAEVIASREQVMIDEARSVGLDRKSLRLAFERIVGHPDVVIVSERRPRPGRGSRGSR